jgi:hypothetical protein
MKVLGLKRMRPALANFLRNPMPFSVLTRSVRPAIVAHVQTDGSFTPQVSRTATLLKTVQGEEYSLFKTYFEHKNCGHSEWCSVLDGILFSVKKDQGSVELENDCLGVVRALAQKRQPVDRASAYFYGKIWREIRGLEHFGIRWIPREMNRADELFRI